LYSLMNVTEFLGGIFLNLAVIFHFAQNENLQRISGIALVVCGCVGLILGIIAYCLSSEYEYQRYFRLYCLHNFILVVYVLTGFTFL